MNENKQKVVKCISCDKFFGYAEDNKNCPFCNTEYGEVERKETEDLSMQSEKEVVGVEEKTKTSSAQAGKKVVIKSPKDSFKIWKDH